MNDNSSNYMNKYEVIEFIGLLGGQNGLEFQLLSQRNANHRKKVFSLHHEDYDLPSI